MCRKPKPSRPCFYKTFFKDFSRKLRLPASFVQKYREILPEKAKIRAGSGKKWNVKVERMEDGQYCFSRGWVKFAEDAGLEFGESLVFWLDSDKSRFDVAVFGKNGREREINPGSTSTFRTNSDPDQLGKDQTCMKPQKVKKKESKARVVEDEDVETDNHNSWKEDNPKMQIVLNQSRKFRVSLRKDFAESARLIGKRAAVVEYVPCRGRYWGVLLDSPKNLSQFRLDMTVGWNDFRKANKLVLGNKYSLEFNPAKNVIQVRAIDPEK